MQLYLYLLVGRLERQHQDTVQLMPATDEDAAHAAFLRSLRDDEDDDRVLDIDASICVGEYTGTDTVRVPEGTDWHLSTVYPLGVGLPIPTNVQVRPDGDANVYTLLDGGNWIASVRMNGELTTFAQEAFMRRMADALKEGD